MLAVAAVLMPGYAASQSPLSPPAMPIVLAGLIGLLIGYDRAASIARSTRHSPFSQAANRITHAVVWLAGAVLLIALVGNVLPPVPLVIQDLQVLIERARGAADLDTRTPLFLSSSISRFLLDASNAPLNGEQGARLLLGLSGAVLTWVAAIIFGHALANLRHALVSVLPLIGTLALIAIPGGEGGLALGLGLLGTLLFAATATAARQTRGWEARKIDYSTEIAGDIGLWAGLVIAVALAIAWVIPLWPGNPVSALLATIGETPSGVAALERGVDRGSGNNPTRIGLSTLPSLRLGNSIAQGPPGQIALQVILNAPLERSAPIYWRMRLLEHYRSNDWASDAIVSGQTASAIQPGFEGAVVQTIVDRRPDRQLLVGLPDILAISIPTRLERLQDGSLSAIAGNPSEVRYQLLSRPQALAPLPQRDQTPPDMTPYLALPAELPPRVRELAAAIVGRQRDPRAQAIALETYLRQLPYQYEVQPLPAEGDAVDQFLFEMRSGYCTYYASSMAIMARTLGIPSRIAIGYATGELEPDGSYLVREADAHAWPELYLNERWVIYEPTPIRALPDRGAPPPDIQAIDSPSSMFSVRLPAWQWIIGAIALLLLAISAIRFGLPRLSPRTIPDPLSLAADDLERAGLRVGIAWPRGATLREYRDRLLAHAGVRAEPIQQTAGLIERGRYTGKALSAEELARLDESRSQLRE